MNRRLLFCLALSLSCISAGHQVLFAGSGPAARQATPRAAAQIPASRTGSLTPHLPLLFEQNAGQFDPAVRFLARTPGYALFLTADAATLVVEPRETAPRQEERDPLAASRLRQGHVVRMRFAGSRNDATIEGVEKSPVRVQYAVGFDPKARPVDVPAYQRVEYAGLYPGIDLVYYGHDGRLEYDFVVAPHADASAIGIVFDGVDDLSVNDDGDLVLDTPAGRLVQARPVTYQDVNGQRREVESAYVRIDAHSVGVRLGQYDRTAPLRIDPVLAYSTYIGGTGGRLGEQAYGIATDAMENVYLTGTTNSTIFPMDGGVPVNDDMWVLKMTPAGQVDYIFVMNGNSADSGEGIAVDPAGQVAITGYTDSTNLPLLNAMQGPGGLRDAYVLKLDASGSPVFMTYVGGSLGDGGESVAFDPSGNIYAGGYTASANFPLMNPLRSVVSNLEAWIAKFDPSGNLLYSTLVGGTNSELVESLQVDAAGNLYAAGWTASSDFPKLPAAGQKKQSGEDVFVLKIAPDGSALVYSRLVGGNNNERSFALALDGTGSIYVGGRTDSTNFPRIGSLQADQPGTDAFLTRLDQAGTVTFSTYLGGDGWERVLGLAVRNGTLYVSGQTFSTNFPLVNPIQAAKAGTTTADAYVLALSVGTHTIVFSTYLGGAMDEEGRGVAPVSGGNVWVGGWTASADFPTVNPIQDVLTQTYNVILVRIAPLRVTGVSPAFGFMAGGQTVTVSGEAFQSGASVLVGGLAATDVAFVDAQTLTAVTPALPAGSVNVSVVNPNGDSDTLYGAFEVLASAGPVAKAGADQSVSATDAAGALVTLDGSATFDPDNDPLSIAWTDENNVLLGTTAVTTTTLSLGVHTLTLTASDGHSPDGADTVVVTVVDNAPPTVSVTMPNTTNNLYTNTPVTLEWTAADNESGLASFDVFLSTDGGSTWGATPICAAVGGAARSCVWNTPGPVTTKGRIKVVARDAAGNTASDTSNVNFKIAAGSGSITVSTPNTAVNWATGSTQQLKWSHNLGAGSLVRIELSTDGGATWSPVADPVVNGSSSGTYNWVVPGTITNAARIRVSWNHGPVTDISNVNFTIAAPFITVSAPKSGANWGYGSFQKPTWTSNLGLTDRVEVLLSTDGGATFPTVLASNILASDKSATITTPTLGAATTTARVRVRWSNAPVGFSGQGNNPANFQVAPPFVTVTAPNGGNVWTVGTSPTVSWTHNLGTLENVKIELSQDDGASFPIVVLASTVSDGSQAVTVDPSWVTALARIRVSWVKTPSVADTSNASFTVQ